MCRNREHSLLPQVQDLVAALESYRAEHESSMARKELEIENAMEQLDEVEKSMVSVFLLTSCAPNSFPRGVSTSFRVSGCEARGLS